jgi:hypothetical protein
MATQDVRYASVTTIKGKVTDSSGWDTIRLINKGMNETEALNLLGKSGYRPYKVTEEKVEVQGVESTQMVFRLCNIALPQVV